MASSRVGKKGLCRLRRMEKGTNRVVLYFIHFNFLFPHFLVAYFLSALYVQLSSCEISLSFICAGSIGHLRAQHSPQSVYPNNRKHPSRNRCNEDQTEKEQDKGRKEVLGLHCFVLSYAHSNGKRWSTGCKKNSTLWKWWMRKDNRVRFKDLSSFLAVGPDQSRLCDGDGDDDALAPDWGQAKQIRAKEQLCSAERQNEQDEKKREKNHLKLMVTSSHSRRRYRAAELKRRKKGNLFLKA